MKLKQQLVALATVAALGTGGSAQAFVLWPGDFATTTTTVGGIGALIYFLVIKKKPAEEEPAKTEETTKAAFLYLRENHLQLTADLARGEGPVLEELASAAHIRIENKAAFSAAMQSNAAELIELSNPETLDEARATRFVERYLEILRAEPALAQDLASLS